MIKNKDILSSLLEMRKFIRLFFNNNLNLFKIYFIKLRFFN